MMVLLLFLPFSQTLMPQPIDSSSPWQRSKAPTLNPKPQENQLPNDASDKPVNPEGLCAHIVRVLPHRVAVYTRGQIKSFVYICVYIYLFVYIYIYITVIITFIHVHMCIYIYKYTPVSLRYKHILTVADWWQYPTCSIYLGLAEIPL